MLAGLIAIVGLGCAPEGEMNGLAAEQDPGGGGLDAELRGNESPNWALAESEGKEWGFVGTPVEEEPELLADSVTEYSPVQGERGWTYGYLEPGGTGTFAEMRTYVAGGADPGWYAGAGGVYWTMMDAESAHPNGETTTGGREPVEQWAVRRWTSDVAGEVDVTGQFAKLAVDGESNGAAAYIYVDGVLSWAWYIEGWDDKGVDYVKRLVVAEGSTVDFVLDPWQADDRSDRSRFTAQIWTVAD